MAETITAITEAVAGAPDLWMNAVQRISSAKGSDGASLNLNKNIPGADYTVRDVDAKLMSALSLVRALDQMGDHSPVPSTFISNMNDRASNAVTAIKQLDTDLNNLESNGGIAGINVSDWIFVAAQENFSVNAADRFKEIFNCVEKLLIAYYQLAPIVSGAGYEAFASAASKLSELLSSALEVSAEISEAKQSINSSKSEIDESLTTVSNLVTSISSIKAQVDELSHAISESKNLSDDTLTEIESINERAEKVKSEVDQFQPTFPR